MSAEVFAVHGVAASETGTALADALIALCDEAVPSDRRAWLVFNDRVDEEAAAHIDKIISLSPSTLNDIAVDKVLASPLDGPALTLFEPLPEAPTRSLTTVLIDATGDSPWIRRLVATLLGKYTLTVASRDQDELVELFRTEGVWSLVAPRRTDWVDLLSRHDLIITGNAFTAAMANGLLKPALLVDHDPVADLPACPSAELDAMEDQLTGLDMVAMGADLLNAKRAARERALALVREMLAGTAT